MRLTDLQGEITAVQLPAVVISSGHVRSDFSLLYDANTILAATADNTPAALTIAASRIVGRKSTGDIAALTAAETLAILDLQAGVVSNASSPWNSLDVSGKRIVHSAGNNMTINGFSGGVDGQVIHVLGIGGATYTVNHNNASGTQKILTPGGTTFTNSTYAGFSLVCISGNWYFCGR